MMHDGAFQYISYFYRVSAHSIPKISFLPVLEPTEKISNTHTYIHTYTHTYAHTLHYYIDDLKKSNSLQMKMTSKTIFFNIAKEKSAAYVIIVMGDSS